MKPMRVKYYQNRHGGFDIIEADSTLMMPLAACRTKADAERFCAIINSHADLVASLRTLSATLDTTFNAVNHADAIATTTHYGSIPE